MIEDSAYVGIDRKGNMLFSIFIYDNGPDYVEEGLFRFVENEKTGFANMRGQKIIPAKYDFAAPFAEGVAEYYIGGEQISEFGKTKQQIIQESGYEGLFDLHWVWGGDVIENGYLKRYGNEFEKIGELKNNKRDAWTKDKKHVLLNKKGRVIKTYSN